MLKVKQWLGLSLVIGCGWVCVGVAQDQLHSVVYPNPMPETIEAGCAYHGYDYQGNQTCITITNTSDQPIGMSNGPVPFETLSAERMLSSCYDDKHPLFKFDLSTLWWWCIVEKGL